MSPQTLTSMGPQRLAWSYRKRWTVAEFHQLRSASWLESRRLILVEGEILEMPSPNPPHDASRALTDEVLRGMFGRGCWLRGQMALLLGLATDPVLDPVRLQGARYQTVSVVADSGVLSPLAVAGATTPGRDLLP